jgi:hypothetical protein
MFVLGSILFSKSFYIFSHLKEGILHIKNLNKHNATATIWGAIENKDKDLRR